MKFEKLMNGGEMKGTAPCRFWVTCCDCGLTHLYLVDVDKKKELTMDVAKRSSGKVLENSVLTSSNNRFGLIVFIYRRMSSRRSEAIWATASPCPETSASSMRVIRPDAQLER